MPLLNFESGAEGGALALHFIKLFDDPIILLQINFPKRLSSERLRSCQVTLFAHVQLDSNFLWDVYLRVSVSDTFSNM